MGSESRSGILVQKRTMSSLGSMRCWKIFVDLVSIIWLGAFITSLFSYDFSFFAINPNIIKMTDTITLFTLPVFVADLMIKYYILRHSKTFFKEHWIAILFVVPYIRLFRIFSMVKVLGFVRLGRIPQTWGVIVNLVKAAYKALRIGRG